MRILFTGSSSFTGYWFIRELLAAGHEVTATFRGNPADYSPLRRRRAEAVQALCACVVDCPFGSDSFLGLLARSSSWDILCHHGAEVRNYGSPDFDVLAAVRDNSWRAGEVLAKLVRLGCRRVVLTGSVFEAGEGAGDLPLRAFSPYGLSKTLTAEVFRYHAETLGLPIAKFVIANPFGPWEEPRFTTYLVKEWFAGRVPVVRTPDYVRDNIPVDLLARRYAAFVASAGATGGFLKTCPCGYVQSQGEFARRFAAEMAPRIGRVCPVDLAEQKEFCEPRVRTGTDELDVLGLGWNEAESWDRAAEFYGGFYGPA